MKNKTFEKINKNETITMEEFLGLPKNKFIKVSKYKKIKLVANEADNIIYAIDIYNTYNNCHYIENIVRGINVSGLSIGREVIPINDVSQIKSLANDYSPSKIYMIGCILGETELVIEVYRNITTPLQLNNDVSPIVVDISMERMIWDAENLQYKNAKEKLDFKVYIKDINDEYLKDILSDLTKDEKDYLDKFLKELVDTLA